MDVTDTNEPPVLTGPSTPPDYPEGDTAEIARYTADDPEQATIDWTLTGQGSDFFELDTTGVLTFRAPPDYEQLITDRATNEFILLVGASDRTHTPTQEVTVTVTNVDEDGTVSLTPSQPRVGTAVVAAVADPDGGVTNIGWSWERSQNRTDWTTLSETTNSYTPTATDVGYYLRATASYDDGHSAGRNAEAVSASPVRAKTPPPPPPPPPRTGGGRIGGSVSAPPAGLPAFAEGSRASRTVAENTPAGVDIGEPVTATDPDEDPLTYTLIGSDRGAFDIDASSGQLRTKASLNYETKDTYVLTVEVRGQQERRGRSRHQAGRLHPGNDQNQER